VQPVQLARRDPPVSLVHRGQLVAILENGDYVARVQLAKANLAEREAALFQQILMPGYRHRTPETRQKLVETIAELTRLTDELKRHLLNRAVADVFEDVV